MKDKDFFTEFVIHNVTMLNENKESAQLSVSRTRKERQALDSTDGQEHKNLSLLRLVLKIKRNHNSLEN